MTRACRRKAADAKRRRARRHVAYMDKMVDRSSPSGARTPKHRSKKDMLGAMLTGVDRATGEKLTMTTSLQIKPS